MLGCRLEYVLGYVDKVAFANAQAFERPGLHLEREHRRLDRSDRQDHAAGQPGMVRIVTMVPSVRANAMSSEMIVFFIQKPR